MFLFSFFVVLLAVYSKSWLKCLILLEVGLSIVFFASSDVLHWLLCPFILVGRLKRHLGLRFIYSWLFLSILIFHLALSLGLCVSDRSLLLLAKTYFFLFAWILRGRLIISCLVGRQELLEGRDLMARTLLALTITGRLVLSSAMRHLLLPAFVSPGCSRIRRGHLFFGLFVLKIRWHEHWKLTICWIFYLCFWSRFFLLFKRSWVLTFAALLTEAQLAFALIELFVWEHLRLSIWVFVNLFESLLF